jgi:hypothetical protein
VNIAAAALLTVALAFCRSKERVVAFLKGLNQFNGLYVDDYFLYPHYPLYAICPRYPVHQYNLRQPI